MDANDVLNVRKISKRFQDVPANDRVDFDLQRGEIHALLGENGAGKSTLMNIICGLYRPDSGEIDIEGQPVDIRNPRDAIRLGIGMVHQHFMLVPTFSVAENISLGAEVTRTGLIDLQTPKKNIRKLSSAYGLHVVPEALTGNLPVGIQQRVEILKALYRQSKILILDEPTAVLTPPEVDDLFAIMRRLAANGVAIVFITHKLKEVARIAHRISVMRRGHMIQTMPRSETDENELAALMVGHRLHAKTDKRPARPGEIILEVQNLSLVDERKVEVVRDVSFEVRAGEILGIAGVQGNGQTELVRALCGLWKIEKGRLRLRGKPVKALDPRGLNRLGVAHIPEDRLNHGLVQQYSVADNQILCDYYKPPFASGWLRNRDAQLNHSKRLIDQFDIRPANPQESLGALSGGNQQKVIISRELSRPICLLVANQPTRGLDVASMSFVHQKIIDIRDRGVAVLLVSVELDEIMALSDRIAVMFGGQIISIFAADQFSKTQLGLMMTGTVADGMRPQHE
jgi:simple sugar transport system ATP-binding protein